MLIELLSLMFHIYWWMKWLQGDGLLPETDELMKMFEQKGNDAEE